MKYVPVISTRIRRRSNRTETTLNFSEVDVCHSINLWQFIQKRNNHRIFCEEFLWHLEAISFRLLNSGLNNVNCIGKFFWRNFLQPEGCTATSTMSSHPSVGCSHPTLCCTVFFNKTMWAFSLSHFVWRQIKRKRWCFRFLKSLQIFFSKRIREFDRLYCYRASRNGCCSYRRTKIVVVRKIFKHNEFLLSLLRKIYNYK